MTESDDKARPAAATRRPWKGRVVVALLAVVVGAGIYWWLDAGRHLFFPKNWGVVKEGRIFRSGRIHRRIIQDVLADNGIQVVVDLAGTDDWDPNFQPERDAAQALNIPHHTFTGLDGYGIGSLDDYANAFALLLEARRDGKPILVHCGGGSERTGAIFAWYRMLFDGWDGARTYAEYLDYRGSEPKTDALQTFVNKNFPEIIERAKQRGLVEEVPDPLPVFGPRGTARK